MTSLCLYSSFFERILCAFGYSSLGVAPSLSNLVSGKQINKAFGLCREGIRNHPILTPTLIKAFGLRLGMKSSVTRPFCVVQRKGKYLGRVRSTRKHRTT